MTREQLQKEGEEAYFKSSGKATIMVGTGGGKSKIAVEIAKKLNPPQILFLSNSERGRDITFKDEFEKWGAKELWESKVVAECYQTAYKWKGMHFPLVIADEIDFAMTDEFSKFFLNNDCDKIVGLTGFATPEKRELLEKIAPVCYEVSTQQLQEAGVLNDTQFVVVQFDLDMVNKNRKVQYGPKSNPKVFYQTENEQYNYWQNQYVKALTEKRRAEGELSQVYSLIPGGDIIDRVEELEGIIAKSVGQLKYAAGKRKELLFTLNSSKDIVRKIVTLEAGKKILVFSKRIEQIESICKYTFHSRNKKDNTNIEKLNRGEISLLGVCDAINRGENLSEVNVLIKESYDGSETAFQQQHGRGMRLDADDVMKYYILVPFYHESIIVDGKASYARVPTQAVKWANAMTTSFNTSNKISINAKDL